jgi:hypothetical protein
MDDTQRIVDSFSTSYAEAREKFLRAAHHAGLAVESHAHPLKGKDGEALAMDVVRDGPMDATKLLIVSSGCHGVEGYCGTGVQVHALGDKRWLAAARASGVAVLYIHALNPYGFSHVRRVTQENVDLNRNFHDFSKPLPSHAAYAHIHELLLPKVWPPDEANRAAVQGFIAANGLDAFQAAVAGGQHDFADGLFFGGRAPTWSNTTLRQVLHRHGASAQKLAWIDIHTGLGPSGHGERIFASRDEPAAFARAQAWWGGGGRTPVTSIYDGSSSSPKLTGLMPYVAYDECPNAEFTAMAMEYGTVSVLEVLEALRGDHWLALHPEAPAALHAHIKRAMMAAFYTDTPHWKTQIVAQADESMRQALVGLAG